MEGNCVFACCMWFSHLCKDVHVYAYLWDVRHIYAKSMHFYAKFMHVYANFMHVYAVFMHVYAKLCIKWGDQKIYDLHNVA